MRTSVRGLTVPVVACLAMVLLGVSAAPDPSPLPSVSPAVLESAPPAVILDITVVPQPIQPGKPVSITIHTTAGVAEIEGHVFAHTFTIPKTGDGVFYGAGNVPWWARFFHGTVNVTFVASDAGGTPLQEMVEPIHM